MERNFKWLPVFLLLAMLLAACGDSGSAGNRQSQSHPLQAKNPGDEKAISLYKSNCMTCHGTELQGRIGPALNTVGTMLTQEQIMHKIENGGGGMPTFKKMLKPEDIQALAAWLEGYK